MHKWEIARQNGTKCTQYNTDSKGPRNSNSNLIYMSALSSLRDGEKCIATVPALIGQQQQEINVTTFTQNPHLEDKRPSLFTGADKERKYSHIRNVIDFYCKSNV